MTITILRILFYGLMPMGVFILIMAIRQLRKSFFGKILVEIRFTQREAEIDIVDSGDYGIWQKGKLLKRTLFNRFDLQLVNTATGHVISLHNSFFAPHVNSLDTGRIEWKRFNAPIGRYHLRLIEQTSHSISRGIFSALMSNNPVDYSQYWLQVRESQPAYFMIIAIPMIILSVACIFGGLVLAINAKEVAMYLGW
jgi:hypothetical protein